MVNERLKLEREALLLNWITSSKEEKLKILIKIMDIDESLASEAKIETRKNELYG